MKVDESREFAMCDRAWNFTLALVHSPLSTDSLH
jgi:hypothetical protein